MKISKKFILSFIFVFTALILVACGANRMTTWQKIEQTKTINIGYNSDFEPLSTSTDNTQGFIIDLGNAAFKSYDTKVNWKALDWESKERELQKGKIDLIWGPYIENSNRDSTMIFSKPFLESQIVLLVDKNSGIDTLSDMNGKIVGGQKASAEYDVFSQYPNILKNIVKENLMSLYDTPTDGLTALSKGKIQGLLVDKLLAERYIKYNPQYTIIKSSYPTVNYVVAARKNDKLLIDKVNAALDKLNQSGELQDISQRWFTQ